MKFSIKVDRFWLTYFCIRIFYLFFSVLVYGHLTTLGDTARYLNSGLNFSWMIFLNSTRFMDFVGGFWGSFLGGESVLSNLPFTLYSFMIIRWSVQKMYFQKYVSSGVLLLLISLPNFCIWTSVAGKEVFGLTFSAIYAILFVNYLKGNYEIRWRDVFATYLCLLFKPQYFPFIFQGLLYLYLAGKICYSWKSKFILGILFVILNCLSLYLVRDLVNKYAEMMYIHFNIDGAESTRENIFYAEGDFFRYAPSGMFWSFWGPTFNEMLGKWTHLFAGLESFVILFLFLFLSKEFIARFLLLGKIDIGLFFSYFILFTGICFIHYPFGIFNPGSAIRYRTNFIYLFIVLLLYLYSYFKEVYIQKSRYNVFPVNKSY